MSRVASSFSCRHEDSLNERNAFRLKVPYGWFVTCWMLVAVFRAGAICFLTAMVWLYLWLLHDKVLRTNTLGFLRFQVSDATLRLFIGGFVAVDALQCFMLVRTVKSSLKARRLVFQDYYTSSRQTLVVERPWTLRHCLRCWQRVWLSWMQKWIEPVFYIHGLYFDHYFVVREYLEVLSQLYQGYWMSINIATRWINHVFVTMIFLNCISTAVIHALVPSSQMPLRRFASVLCSTFLNFINSVVLPLVIFMPYAREFRPTTKDFPELNYMDDVWYGRAIRENQQLFVTSYLDFWATWMPHWSLFSCLVTCEDLIRCQTSPPSPSFSTTLLVGPDGRTNRKASATSHKSMSNHRPPTSKLSGKKEFFLYSVLCVAGLIVLGVHIAAQSPAVLGGCRLTSTPWLASKSSCNIMNVNCFRRQIEGNERQIHDVLVQINPDSVFQLLFTHCPRLEIPVMLREFHHLGGLDFYNDSIVSWPLNASMRQQDHPELDYVFVFRSNVSNGTVPDGLLDAEFPVQLNLMAFYQTNLASLPAQAFQSWRTVATLDLEFGQLDHCPSALSTMEVITISLTGNPLTQPSKPDLLSDSFQIVWLSNNSLTSLPTSRMGDLDQITELEMEFTKLSHVPEYLREWFLNKTRTNNHTVQHSLFGSPYCNRSLRESQDDEEAEYAALVCAEDHGSAAGYFSLHSIEVMARQRSL